MARSIEGRGGLLEPPWSGGVAAMKWEERSATAAVETVRWRRMQQRCPHHEWGGDASARVSGEGGIRWSMGDGMWHR